MITNQEHSRDYHTKTDAEQNREWADMYRRIAALMRKHGHEDLAKIWDAFAEKFEEMNDDDD